MQRSPLTRILRPAFALVLSLWIAGAGCMLGCEGMAAAATGHNDSAASASGDLATIVSGEACASKSHDCCAHRRKTADAAPVEKDHSTVTPPLSSSAGVEGCPLAVGRAAVSNSTRRDNSPATIVSPALAATVANASELVHFKPEKLRIPNRGHTYLRCCSFLI